MNRKQIAAAVSTGVIVIAGAAYIGMAQQYKNIFFPGTVINGIPADGETIDQVKEKLEQGVNGYVLKLVSRTGTDEISGADIDLHVEYDGTLERMMAEQNPYLWGIHAFQKTEYAVPTMTAFDESRLEAILDGFSCMDESRMEDPVDAEISGYIENVGYEIIPERQGTRLDVSAAEACIRDAVYILLPELSLDEAGVYAEPEITSQTDSLAAQWKELQQYKDMTVIYEIGGEKEILEGITLHQWITKDETGNDVVDDGAVDEFVSSLAQKYDTAYQPKLLKTTYGYTVRITKGNYGWRIDKKKEAAALKERILSGRGEERTPIYLQTAASYDVPDYGDTYVEINLSTQHLYYYKQGQLVAESDFVSGNVSRGNGTPGGAYPITYKQRNAVLKGQGYASPVSYWMPFNRGIGMHDATWRGSFGGNIFRTSGSHGCINLPLNAAKTIYENIEAGTAVLCYFESDKVEDAPAETGAAAGDGSATGTGSVSEPEAVAAAGAAQSGGSEQSAAAVPAPAESALPQAQPADSSSAEPYPEPAQPSQQPSAVVQPIEASPAQTEAPGNSDGAGPSSDIPVVEKPPVGDSSAGESSAGENPGSRVIVAPSGTRTAPGAQETVPAETSPVIEHRASEAAGPGI